MPYRFPLGSGRKGGHALQRYAPPGLVQGLGNGRRAIEYDACDPSHHRRRPVDQHPHEVQPLCESGSRDRSPGLSVHSGGRESFYLQ